MSRPLTQKHRMPLAITLFVIAIAVFAFRIVPYTAAYRNWKFAAMSIDEQMRSQAQYTNDPLFLYHLGRKLNQSGQFAAADPVLERAAGLDPDSATIRDAWAQALMGHGRVSIAFGILRQFMGSHPKAAEPPLLLGKFYVSREDWAPASRALETAVKLGPQSGEAWSLLAHARIKMGSYGSAQTALAKAIEFDPGNADNHLQLAVLLGANDSPRARREYLRAVELAPKDPICLRQFGRFLLDTGDPKGAEQKARAAVAQKPQDMPSQLLLGMALETQGRSQEAIAPLEEAARLAPTDVQPPEQLRHVYRQLHQADLAAQWDARYLTLTQGADERRKLLDATQAHPQDTATHHQFAVALAQIADVNGCLREEAFASKTPPDNPRALTAAARDLDGAGYSSQALPLARQAAIQRLNPAAQEVLANVLLHLGRLHEAAIRYEQIKDWRKDQMVRYRQMLAEAALRLKQSQVPAEKLLRASEIEPDRSKAETLLDQAVQLEPENTRCLRALLRVQFSRQEIEKAVATATKLCAISPEDGVAHTYYVSARLQQIGDQPLSEPVFQELSHHLQEAEKDPTILPTLFYDRGLIALKQGQGQTALQFLEQARQLDPNTAGVYHALAEAKSQAGDKIGAQQAQAEFERRQTPEKEVLK